MYDHTASPIFIFIHINKITPYFFFFTFLSVIKNISLPNPQIDQITLQHGHALVKYTHAAHYLALN